MKIRRYFIMAVVTIVAGVVLTSCGSDNNDEPKNPGEGTTEETEIRKAFILNEGSWNGNNASIAMYAPNGDAEFERDIYFAKNNAKLGDLANDMEEDDDNLYVLLNGSKYVARLNSEGAEQARYKMGDNDGTPRWLEVEDGYVYVSQYGGKVCKLDAKTLSLVGEYHGGNNLEGVAIENGKLYVANAYKVDGSGNYVYNTEVHVVDVATMKQTGIITVIENPEKITKIDDKIYVMSNGNYADISPSMQLLDLKAGKSIHITNADKITKGNNGLIYGVRSVYDANWALQNEFFIYNPKTGEVTEKSFLKDAPSSFATIAIYLLEVDEETGDIYVGTSDYVSTGTIYRFDKNGNLKESFDSGGINPKALVFID